MFWFILLFPLLIYPWGPEPYYSLPKVFYLDVFVLSTWIILIYKRVYWTKNIKQRVTITELIVGLFLCLVVLSTVNSVNKSTSMFGTTLRYEGLLTFTSYCSILVFSFRLLDSKQLEKIISRFVLVSILVSIYGILQHYFLDFLPRNLTKINYDRSFAFFDNPNFFGSYLVIMLMLSVSLFISGNNKISRVFSFIATCLTYIAMLFSGTRSAWVGVFFSMLFLTVFVVLKRRSLWKRWGILLVSFVSIFLLINTIEEGGYLNRLFSSVSDPYKVMTKQSTGREGSNRIFIWEKSLPLIPQYFLLGSGPDTFKYIFPNDTKETKEKFGDQKVDKAHNEYIQMAVTLGVPALLTYLLLVTVVLRKAFQAVKVVREKEKIILYGLISAIFGYLVQAFFNISVVTVAPLYWSILGITFGISTHHLANAKNLNLVKESYHSNEEDQTA